MKSWQTRYLYVALAFSLFAGLACRSTRAAITTNGNLTAASGVPYNGTDNPWATDSLFVGNSAPGSVAINAGYVVQNNGGGIIAYSSTASISSVTINGAGSNWTSSSFLEVGYAGTGMLDITGGGSVSSKTGYVGGSIGSSGAVSVGGGIGSSSWTTNSSELYIGIGGTGTLDIIGGGNVSSSSGYVGTNSGSYGSVTVGGGTGLSSWTNSSYLRVGSSGNGMLAITGGGSVTSSGGIIGETGQGNGTVTVGGGTGSSSWTTSDLTVGYIGAGALNIIGGGSVSSSYGSIGNSSLAGTVTVGGGTGPSFWTNSSKLAVGDLGGKGTLNIKTGGAVGALGLEGSGIVNFDGGTLAIKGTDSASNTINLLAGGGSIDVPTLATTFTITRAIGGAGGLTKIGQATLALSGANTYAGGTTVSDGMLTLSGATAKLGTGNVSIQSSAAGSVLQIQTGVSNAIANTANLSLFDGSSGGGLSAGIAAALVPNRAYVDLGAGINEAVSMLLFNGVAQGPGTYGSSTSSATFKNDNFFAGNGMITVLVPEPASAVLLMLGLASLITCRRR